ncbi:MAG: 16S rRNA processing protein RimM [Eubacterium sp.]|jgi:16S rRNA processing protein RimM|nr:16S rRNA processing protein RimM [Eubacterium sp.]
MEDLLRIGVITTTHGVRGEVKVFPTTDDPKRFDHCKEVILVTKKEQIPLHVEKVKYFKNLVILKFKEYNNINQVEQFRKCDIMVTRENAVPLEEGEYFICDIIGAEVVEEDGTLLGTVKDVMDTGANQVFVITSQEGRELLFPSIPECIKKVDTENKQVVAHVMPGLLDL